MKTADFNGLTFFFLIKKIIIMRKVTKSFGFFSYKVPFFLVVSAFFDKYALPLLKRNVNTSRNSRHHLGNYILSASATTISQLVKSGYKLSKEWLNKHALNRITQLGRRNNPEWGSGCLFHWIIAVRTKSPYTFYTITMQERRKSSCQCTLIYIYFFKYRS